MLKISLQNTNDFKISQSVLWHVNDQGNCKLISSTFCIQFTVTKFRFCNLSENYNNFATLKNLKIIYNNNFNMIKTYL